MCGWAYVFLFRVLGASMDTTDPIAADITRDDDGNLQLQLPEVDLSVYE